MKKITLLFLTISISFTSVAQEQVTKEGLAVQQTIIKLFTALSNRDSAGLRFHSRADVHFYEYGQVWTIDSLIQKVMLVKPADYKRTNSFEFIKTTIEGNTAWVTYYLQSEITRNGKKELVKWMETVVLIKQKEQWKIQLLHSSLISRT